MEELIKLIKEKHNRIRRSEHHEEGYYSDGKIKIKYSEMEDEYLDNEIVKVYNKLEKSKNLHI